MTTFPYPLKLSTIAFDNKSNKVSVSGLADAPTFPPAILVDLPTNTGGGNDSLKAAFGVSLNGDGVGGEFAAVLGLRALSLGSGDDSVSGSINATASGPNNRSTFKALSIAASMSGDGGSDTFRGATHVTVSGVDADTIAFGIQLDPAALLSTGSGADHVIASADASFAVTHQSFVTAIGGGADSAILTGDGADTIVANAKLEAGTARANAAGAVAFVTTAIDGVSILTGSGDDTVTAHAKSAAGGVGATTASDGFVSVKLDMGSGADTLDVRAEDSGAANISGAFALQLSQVAMGTGNDEVRIVALADGAGPEAWGLRRSTLDLGSGGNDVDIRVQSNGAKGDAKAVLEQSAITGGSGADHILIHADATGESSIAVGVLDSAVDLGGGRDRLDVAASAEGTAIAFSAATIRGGLGDDIITGQATGPAGFGASQAEFFLGDGDDLLTLRGHDGGLQRSNIDAGVGDDRLDVQSFAGPCIVDGGAGDDWLIFQGPVSGFSFNAGMFPGTVTIHAGGINDTMNVSGIEHFVFAGQAFTLDQLLV